MRKISTKHETYDDAAACRQWMKEVLQPLNDKAANAIVDHVDLIEASSVDPLLLKLVAYVKTVRVMMSRYALSRCRSTPSVKFASHLALD